MQYVWLIWTFILLGIWFLVFFFKKKLRKEMMWASLWTAPLGLTEPLFVPAYWNPPSLFNLAEKTGFDIESIVFSFAIGGLGAIFYEIIFKVKHIRMSVHEQCQPRHRFHLLSLSSTFILFPLLLFFTTLNPIYDAIIAMFLGGIAAMLCRPNLVRKILVGGFLFFSFYFIYFFTLVFWFPSYVSSVWNFSTISGILILGIPIEELLFAFTFGMLWSSFYEHVYWYKVIKVS